MKKLIVIALLSLTIHAQAQKTGIPSGAKVFVTSPREDITGGAAQRLERDFDWQIMPSADKADYTVHFYTQYSPTGSAKAMAKIMKGTEVIKQTRWVHMMGNNGAPEFHYQEAAVYRLIKKEF